MKYRLTDETMKWQGHILHRIEAMKDFGIVKAGDKGGWIEKEENLSQYGDCWVYDMANVYDSSKVYDDAVVYGSAKVYANALVRDSAVVCGSSVVCGNAKVYDSAKVCGNASVCDYAEVYGNAEVYDSAKVCSNAKVCSKRDYIVFKNWWSSGRYFTWTRSNNMWNVGCFYGTGEELIVKAYKDSEESGREYERIVKYVETILKEE